MLFTCDPYGPSTARTHPKKKVKKPETLTVDIHCHLFNPDAAKAAAPHFDITQEPFMKFASELTHTITKKQNDERFKELTGVDERLRDMDEMMIDIQVISTAPAQYYYWAEPGLGLELSQMVNDRIAEVVASHPDRLLGLGTVPLQNTELAIAELERCVNELGFRGIEIGPEVLQEELSADRLEKFWAKCEELDIVVFIHPMGFTQSERLTEHFLSNIISNPLATTVAVHYLIFDGVMDRYPGLKIVLAHGGGYVSHYSGRLDHAHGARPDCCTRIQQPPSHYLKKFYFDTLVFTPHQLEYLAKLYGTDQLLLGTDYPFDMAEYDPVELIDQIDSFSQEDKAKLWGLNAARLLGIG